MFKITRVIIQLSGKKAILCFDDSSLVLTPRYENKQYSSLISIKQTFKTPVG